MTGLFKCLTSRINLGLDYFFRKIKKGSKRDETIRKNIVISYLSKVVDVAANLAIVTFSIRLIGPELYGTWLTFGSLIIWLNFFDIGIGNGLRNHLTKSLSSRNLVEARSLISTAYISLMLIIVFLFFLLLIFNFFADWVVLLNANEGLRGSLVTVSFVIILHFSLNFLLRLINSISYSFQKSYIPDLISAISKLIILASICLSLSFDLDSLIWFSLINTIPISISFIAVTVFFFSKNSSFIPKLSFFDGSLVKKLLNLGGKFLLVQITNVILFSSDNIIISHLFTAADVTPYQTAHKFFNIGLTGFLIILSPSWSAISEAYENKEITWIRKYISNLFRKYLILVFITLLLLLLSNTFYNLWLGSSIGIDFKISIGWAVFVILQSGNLIYTRFLNGIGILRIQMLTAGISLIINIPLSIFLAVTLDLGVSGVIWATNISILMYLVVRGIQYRKIMTNKAWGIWSK